jgi:hypothetical protein
MFPFAEQEPDEHKEVVDSSEAAEFPGLLYSSFREIDPALHGHAVSAQRFVYLRPELLAWLMERWNYPHNSFAPPPHL